MFNSDFILQFVCPDVSSVFNTDNFNLNLAQKLTKSDSTDPVFLQQLLHAPKLTIDYLYLLLRNKLNFDFLLEVDPDRELINLVCFSGCSVNEKLLLVVEKIINEHSPLNYRFGSIIERTSMQEFNLNICFGENMRVFYE